VCDALLQALTRQEADTLWHKDSKKTRIKVIDFRDFRKIAILDKYDAKLLCGQCHVEYNCNPGINLKTGEKIGFTDIRTNHFPFKDVFQIYDHYNSLEFRDFKHSLTGGLLFKAQHPEAEVFWNSKHDKAGVSCNDCHMPKIKSKDGKIFTSHWQTSPKNYIKETCLNCHSKWTQEEAIYTIDSIKSHIRGKIRKAEFWLSECINKIVEAKRIGVDENIIKQAQEQHQKAHILWEWWTAENSDGFHNPKQARKSLTNSVEESKKGIEMLEKAIIEIKTK
jgi:formate-dependent nitrite reductase cytochrome c552 subunit